MRALSSEGPGGRLLPKTLVCDSLLGHAPPSGLLQNGPRQTDRQTDRQLQLSQRVCVIVALRRNCRNARGRKRVVTYLASKSSVNRLNSATTPKVVSRDSTQLVIKGCLQHRTARKPSRAREKKRCGRWGARSGTAPTKIRVGPGLVANRPLESRIVRFWLR